MDAKEIYSHLRNAKASKLEAEMAEIADRIEKILESFPAKSLNPVVLPMAVMHCAVHFCQQAGLNKKDAIQMLDAHPNWDMPRVEFTEHVKEQIGEDPDLGSFMHKFQIDAKNAMQAVKDGRHKSFEDAMTALGYEMDQVENED